MFYDVESQCPYIPQDWNMTVITMTGSGRHAGDVINVTCDSGSRLPNGRPAAFATCLKTAKWSTDIKPCRGMYIIVY